MPKKKKTHKTAEKKKECSVLPLAIRAVINGERGGGGGGGGGQGEFMKEKK